MSDIQEKKTSLGQCPIPKEIAMLFERLTVSPRLGAHLLLVYNSAVQIVDWLQDHYPELTIDVEAILFGAATHDIGKVICINELLQPGSIHEQKGYELLLSHQIDERLARFTHTHATWKNPGITLEDLLVSLSDKIWKGKRVPELEQLIVEHISITTKRKSWEIFMELDDLLDDIAKDADLRLSFQVIHPISNH